MWTKDVYVCFVPPHSAVHKPGQAAKDFSTLSKLVTKYYICTCKRIALGGKFHTINYLRAFCVFALCE